MPPEPEVLDLRVLEEIGLPGGGAQVANFIAMFLREERPRMDQIPRLAAERRAEGLTLAAHALAGSCALLGARETRDAAIRLEMAARRDSWETVAECLSVLQGTWSRLEAALAGYGQP